MSAPALTIGADASLPAAARVMYRSDVGRLLVVDGDSRLRGIVTRSDLLKVHARLDAVIRDEVMQRVLRRTLRIRPGSGPGHRRRRGRHPDRAHRTQDDRRRRRTADRGGPGRHRRRRPAHLRRRRHRRGRSGTQAAERDPLRGWWIGRTPPGQPAGQPERPVNHDEQTVTRSAALQ